MLGAVSLFPRGIVTADSAIRVDTGVAIAYDNFTMVSRHIGRTSSVATMSGDSISHQFSDELSDHENHGVMILALDFP